MVSDNIKDTIDIDSFDVEPTSYSDSVTKSYVTINIRKLPRRRLQYLQISLPSPGLGWRQRPVSIFSIFCQQVTVCHGDTAHRGHWIPVNCLYSLSASVCSCHTSHHTMYQVYQEIKLGFAPLNCPHSSNYLFFLGII